MPDDAKKTEKLPAEKPAGRSADKPGGEKADGKTGPDSPAAAAGKPGETEVGARLDGMRGWLGDLDRTVGVRSRIGLVLAAVAIGAAGAAIYLSLDAKQQSASDKDVSELQSRLGDVEREASDTAQDVTSLKSRVDNATQQASGASGTVKSLQSQVKQLQTDIADVKQSIKAVSAKAESAARTSTAPETGSNASPGDTTGGAKNP
jgi:uncharacterized protein HemX